MVQTPESSADIATAGFDRVVIEDSTGNAALAPQATLLIQSHVAKRSDSASLFRSFMMAACGALLVSNPSLGLQATPQDTAYAVWVLPASHERVGECTEPRYSQHWEVTLNSTRDTVEIRSASNWPDAPSDPAAVRLGASRTGPAFPTALVKRLADGKLVAIDWGECEAAVYWVSDTDTLLLSDEPLIGFVETSAGLIGVVGCAHLLFSEGRLLRFDRSSQGQWKVTPILELPSAAFAIFQPSADSLLLLGPGLAAVDLRAWTIKTVHRPKRGGTSLVRHKAGALYFAHELVVRLTRQGAGYREEWLDPCLVPLSWREPW